MSGNSALWGAGSAVAWGIGDFSARFSSERTGVAVTTFWMMFSGLCFTLLYMALDGIPIHWTLDRLWFLVIAGIGITSATGIFYAALTRGPVSIASPIVASYPAIALPISIVTGARPGLWEWVAMIITLIGVWIATQNKKITNDEDKYSKKYIGQTSLLALSAATIFAFAISSLDIAIESYGPTTSLLGVRVIGILCFIGWFFYQRQLPTAKFSSWWLLALVGLLDTIGHLFLYIGLDSEHGEYAIVASAAYTIITVILARFFLNESISKTQWIGILLVVGGIASLTVLPS